MYEGMRHATVGAEVGDLRGWLERVVPENAARAIRTHTRGCGVIDVLL